MKKEKKPLNVYDIEIAIDPLKLEDSRYVAHGCMWEATTLVQAVKDQECPVFDLPLFALDIGVKTWNVESVMDFAKHMRRVQRANLKYPIIVDDLGFICDGWHRVVKALLRGDTSVKAQRLITMPEPDQREEA